MWLGSSVVRDFETGRVGPDLFADRLIADLGLPVDRGQFLADFAGWPKALFAGAADLVARIPPYLRATLSNTNVLHWPRLTGDLGLGALFDHHFPSHVMGKLKPDREVFAHVAQTLRCEPSAILFLDDQPLNVQAALAAGVRAVRVSGVRRPSRRSLSWASSLRGGDVITIETDRLILRMFREDDLEPYAKICAARRGASRRAAPPEIALYVIHPLLARCPGRRGVNAGAITSQPTPNARICRYRSYPDTPAS